jgi:beta-lactamase regulating signal transducer with metallopeptidase domain
MPDLNLMDSFFAGAVLRVTLLAVIGWLITASILRRRSAAARHLVWLVIMAGALVIPVAMRVASLPLRILPAEVQQSAAPSLRDNMAAVTPATLNSAAALQSFIGDAMAAGYRIASYPSDSTVLLFVLWVVVAAFLMVRHLIGIISARRIVRRARAPQDPEWTRLFSDLVLTAGIRSRVGLAMSNETDVAFACGVFSHMVVVPASAAEWSSDRRRAVLLHELAHIRRRDLPAQHMAKLARAIYWFNPVIWLAAKRLRTESELACDEVVLSSGVHAADYAQHLLDMISGIGTGAPTATLALLRPHEFEGRLIAILDRPRNLPRASSAHRHITIAAFGLIAAVLAIVTPLPRVVEGATPDALSRDTALPSLGGNESEPGPALSASRSQIQEADRHLSRDSVTALLIANIPSLADATDTSNFALLVLNENYKVMSVAAGTGELAMPLGRERSTSTAYAALLADAGDTTCARPAANCVVQVRAETGTGLDLGPGGPAIAARSTNTVTTISRYNFGAGVIGPNALAVFVMRTATKP